MHQTPQVPDAPVPLDGYAETLWQHYQKNPGRPWPDDRMPMRRYEWNQLVHRLALPIEVKAVANALALLGNADGSRVAPADPRVRDGLGPTGMSERQMRRHVAVLRGLKLLHTVRPGGGRGAVDSISLCQLTAPTDGTPLPFRLDTDFTPIAENSGHLASEESDANSGHLMSGIPAAGPRNSGHLATEVSKKLRSPVTETPVTQRQNSGHLTSATVVKSKNSTPRVVSLGDQPTSAAAPEALSLAARAAAAQTVLDDLGEEATEFLIGAAQTELRAEGSPAHARLLIIRAAEIATRPTDTRHEGH